MKPASALCWSRKGNKSRRVTLGKTARPISDIRGVLFDNFDDPHILRILDQPFRSVRTSCTYARGFGSERTRRVPPGRTKLYRPDCVHFSPIAVSIFFAFVFANEAYV